MVKVHTVAMFGDDKVTVYARGLEFGIEPSQAATAANQQPGGVTSLNLRQGENFQVTWRTADMRSFSMVPLIALEGQRAVIVSDPCMGDVWVEGAVEKPDSIDELAAIFANVPAIQEASLLAQEQGDPWPLHVAFGVALDGEPLYDYLMVPLCDALDALGVSVTL